MRPQGYRSPWPPDWRSIAWNRLDQGWDVIIVGGGITGAGILAVAARCGLRVLLLEQADFASGTSGRSSKMVHGGLRYLKHFHLKLTRESVQERQYLLQAASGLVDPLSFIYPVYKGDSPGPWLMGIGLGIYTHLAPDAGKSRRLDSVDLSMRAPGLKMHNLERGFQYNDARTDDARLVLRVLHDGLLAAKGKAVALNYCRAAKPIFKGRRVVGIQVRDEATGKTAEVSASVVINASGVWADELRSEMGARKRLRPLRGSHLFFSLERFPVYQAIAFSHPDDGRPVFVYPWEGVSLVGTTDVDHRYLLIDEPMISVEEADYLLRGVQECFPDFELAKADVVSSQAGVRPVVDTRKKDPSEESRDYVVWPERGLLTVTGGKLTTFRLIAIDALRAAHEMNSKIPAPNGDISVFDNIILSNPIPGVSPEMAPRLCGRYGSAAPQLAASAPEWLTPVQDTPYLWAELIWAAQNEAIVHLDDLLLRRSRLGILLADGGQSLLPSLKKWLQKSLGWDDAHWTREVERYWSIWQIAHGLPPGWRE